MIIYKTNFTAHVTRVMNKTAEYMCPECVCSDKLCRSVRIDSKCVTMLRCCSGSWVSEGWMSHRCLAELWHLVKCVPYCAVCRLACNQFCRLLCAELLNSSSIWWSNLTSPSILLFNSNTVCPCSRTISHHLYLSVHTWQSTRLA